MLNGKARKQLMLPWSRLVRSDACFN